VQGLGYLLPGADNVAGAADEGSWIGAADRNMIIVADEPAQDCCGGVGTVFAAAAALAPVGFGDLGFDLGPGRRDSGLLIGDWRGGTLSQRPGPGADRARRGSFGGASEAL
jgi:hypothetical protein